MTQVSDNEKDVIERAQREADASPGEASAWSDWDDSVLGAESAFPATVIGWDNPAAEEEGSGTANDKWAYVAAMIESERAEAHAARARTRRIALSITGVVVLIILAAALQAFV